MHALNNIAKWFLRYICGDHMCVIFSCQAITTPAMAVSHIMLEAYKKYILVSLILHGKVQPLPKYTSQIVGRFIKVRTNSKNSANTAAGVYLQLMNICP